MEEENQPQEHVTEPEQHEKITSSGGGAESEAQHPAEAATAAAAVAAADSLPDAETQAARTSHTDAAAQIQPSAVDAAEEQVTAADVATASPDHQGETQAHAQDAADSPAVEQPGAELAPADPAAAAAESDTQHQATVAAAEPEHPSSSARHSSSSSGVGGRTSHADASDSAEKPAKPATASSNGGATAAAAAAAPPKPSVIEQHKEESQPHKVASPRHKETAAERLTTPTAMRMLKTLQQTQGGKQEWHIATGVPFKSKRLAPDEMSAMVDRLCTPKHAEDNMPPKPHAVKLAFEGNKEVLVPVKETSKEDNIAYMSSLYERCQETRAKTMQSLQDKWLQPLIKPKQAAAK